MTPCATTRLAFCLFLLFGASACPPGDGAGDTGGDSPAEDVTYVPNEWGFDIRVPDPDALTCWGCFTSGTFGDQGRICSFSYDGLSAIVYASSRACHPEGAMPPEYATAAQLASGGAVVPLEGATYSYGTNHFNDSLEFDYAGLHLRFFHSSFGSLWRRCQPMDCFQVYDSTGTLVEDGCTCERTLPAVCVEIQPDGTWAELVDTFEVCPEDRVCG
ncbi:MAG: hypothetical protein JXB32_18385 [Deltaproteobacteria bacterium]|nr:hypothetical protein [Deltaproteobacteria bacterium]